MLTKKKNDNQPITKDQEEEMSSALIAKLLAEDAMADGHDYYAEYYNDARAYDPYDVAEDQDDSYAEESGDEYSTKRTGKGKGRSKSNKQHSSSGRRGRKRKTDEATACTEDKVPEVQEKQEPDVPTSGISTAETLQRTEQSAPKKLKKPAAEGMNTGVYSELEEQRFLEGLELFGRDWAKLIAHVATRDGNSIRSHTQKHFIKLYRDKIPLPAKVRETGEGYTLSGKPLDPNSAAAKPYLNRGSMAADKGKVHRVEPAKVTLPSIISTDLAVGDSQQVKEVLNIQTNPDPGLPQAATTTTAPTDVTESHLTASVNQPGTETATASVTASSPTVAPPQRERSPKRVAANPQSKSSATQRPPLPAPVYDESGRTNYSKLRLRRPRERKSVNYNQLGKDDDPLTMVKCEAFTGKPGSNIQGCQPFEIKVHSNVLLAMDFHAHLMTSEIIGFLAGYWDTAGKQLTVKEAFPCRSLNTGQNDINVEMDPTSAIETRQMIEDRQMLVVGWYHSHPTFVPDPSIIDIENQRNYQVLCRESCVHGGTEETIEPFVGAIVGPYDPLLPGSASVINWFYVGNSKEERGIPKRLVYDLQDDELLPDEHVERLLLLLKEYKQSPEKVDFRDLWRQDIRESKLEKLIKSLGARMPWIQKKLAGDDTKDLDSFLERVQSELNGW